MLRRINRPTFSEVVTEETLAKVNLGVVLFEEGEEPRSKAIQGLLEKAAVDGVVSVRSLSKFSVSLDGGEALSLRQRPNLEAALKSFINQNVTIDITGMPHNTWAPLVKVCSEIFDVVKVIYVEPHRYKKSKYPREGDVFDLRDRIEGIQAIPLFTNFQRVEDFIVVPLLGFEGARLQYLLEELAAGDGNVYPIIGVPGFRPEYPFFAYLGNAVPLQKANRWQNVRHASANDPFDAFYEIRDLRESRPDIHFKIGMVGTKPHALGAVLCAMVFQNSVELVYDQVVRKRDRSSGIGKIHIYHVGEFLNAIKEDKLAA
jgi:hypothetical protein